jgi:putative ABC transport system permease protein
MKLSFSKIVSRSIIYNLKGVIYQVVIIILLSAVITGSLMTGRSVRNSLRQTAFEKLGNTGILISSGNRYFDPSLVDRMASVTGLNTTGVLELDGYCQHFTTGMTAPRVKIYGIQNDFFSFQGNDGIKVSKGEVAVNEKLASYLGIKVGDELIIRFKTISDLPSDAPFSPGKNATSSVVLKTGSILKPSDSGNFSLGISQITPLNIFINRSDMTDADGKTPKTNRLLFKNQKDNSVQEIYSTLRGELKPEDTGIKLRQVPETGETEIISDRIFIDQLQVDEIQKMSIPSFPLITYLANSITKGTRSAPYSFISAIDQSLYKGVPAGNGIVINKWLAEDLNAEKGDTLKVTWYSPDPMNHLEEKKMDFIVSQVVDMNGIWSDSLLMPEFPGIAGSKSCTDWDAGVEIRMDLIRKKDE